MPTTSVITLATQVSVKHRDVFGTESWNQTRDLFAVWLSTGFSTADVWRVEWPVKHSERHHDSIQRESDIPLRCLIQMHGLEMLQIPLRSPNIFISKAPLLSSGSPCHRAPFGTPWCRPGLDGSFAREGGQRGSGSRWVFPKIGIPPNHPF